MHRNIGLRVLLAALWLLRPWQAGAVQAVVSHTVFYKSAIVGADSAVLEIFWQINPTSLHYRHTGGDSIVASVRTELRILRTADGTVAAGEKYLLVTRPVPVAQTADQILLIGKRYVLPQGDYQLKLSLSDIENSRGDFMYEDSLSATAGQSPYYSSPQVLDTIVNNSSPSVFLKKGKQQFPNTTGFLDDGKTTLHIYYELYHTEALPAKLYPLQQQTFITSKTNESPLLSAPVDTIRSGIIMESFLHDINTETLGSGNYYLHATLRDKDGNALASARTFYQIINKHPKQAIRIVQKRDTGSAQPSAQVERVDVLDLGKTFIAKYTPAQLRAMLKMVSPVAAPDERGAIQGFLKKPDEMYMRFFLYNFFLHRNAKDAGAAWKAYSDTVRQANKQFASGSTPGYETERGGVFMRYGKPLERVPVMNESGAYPYEIWTYDNLGGHSDLAVFLFYQPGFGGDMVLLHSTVAGEVRNPGWRNTLFKNSASGSNTNSRADQYLGNR